MHLLLSPAARMTKQATLGFQRLQQGLAAGPARQVNTPNPRSSWAVRMGWPIKELWGIQTFLIAVLAAVPALVLGWAGLFWPGLRVEHLLWVWVPMACAMLVIAIEHHRAAQRHIDFAWAPIWQAQHLWEEIQDNPTLHVAFGLWLKYPRTFGEVHALREANRMASAGGPP